MQQKILQAARESNRDDVGYSLSGCSFWNLSDEPGTTYCDFSENRELFLSLIEQGMNAIPDPSEPFFSVTYMEYTSSMWLRSFAADGQRIYPDCSRNFCTCSLSLIGKKAVY